MELASLGTLLPMVPARAHGVRQCRLSAMQAMAWPRVVARREPHLTQVQQRTQVLKPAQETGGAQRATTTTMPTRLLATGVKHQSQLVGLRNRRGRPPSRLGPSSQAALTGPPRRRLGPCSRVGSLPSRPCGAHLRPCGADPDLLRDGKEIGHALHATM